MDAQLKKGLIDFCVLAALKDGESYGYRIASDLKSRFALSESTLYPVLRRLEERGEVTCRTEEAGGRLRKYYALSAVGKRRLEGFSDTMELLRKMTEYVQSGGKK